MKDSLQLNHLPIMLILAAAVLIGLFTVKDYGESWDEADIYRYADYARNAYSYFFHPQDLHPFSTDLNFYGPAYFMGASLLARGFTTVIPSWSSIDGWHFTYFLTFLGCALVVYLICTRWVSPPSALGAALLFLSQPLLWGHAFINPKDLPFMAFFTGSIFLGLKMIDRYRGTLKVDITLALAAMVLGVTMSIRVIGPLAGFIVLVYGFYKNGSRFIPKATLYLAIAIIVSYLTWPYLWISPFAHYIESIQRMSQFPFKANILFAGTLYKADQLPRTYFPTFMILQLTEPALLLAGIGFIFSAIQCYKKMNRDAFGLLFAWFLIPSAVIITSGSSLYDNARQLYFLYPPLFIMTALAFERLNVLLVHPAVRAALVLIAVLPGILLGIRLHPYEYVYYNVLASGTGGAYRLFELDYWGTSFRDMTKELNVLALPQAKVLVFGPEQIVKQYSRSDIEVFVPQEQPSINYDYVLFLTRENLDERHCKGAKTIFSIERRGAVLAVLKSIPYGIVCR